MKTHTIFSRGFVSLGGAFIRIWRPGEGLVVELPSCVALNSDDEVIALGKQAAQLEGKLPPGARIIRPFWAENIIDRSFLRLLLEEALRLDRELYPRIWERLTLQYTLVINESISSLHHRWVRKTLEEVWPWPWKELAALRSTALGSKKTMVGERPLLVVDCGFSCVRGAVLVGEETLTFTRDDRLGVEQLCHEFVQLEESLYGITFAPSLFYGQEWGVQQAGMRLSDHQPLLQPAHRETLVAHQKKNFKAFRTWLEEELKKLPQDIRVALQHEGILLIGGGASFFIEDKTLESSLQLPVFWQKTPFIPGGK